MAWSLLFTLLAAGLGCGILGCNDDDDNGDGQDSDSDQGTDTAPLKCTSETWNNVNFTVKVPSDFTGAHDKLAATWYENWKWSPLGPPQGFAGDTVNGLEIGPDKPYVWNGNDDCLKGMYQLVIVLYAPGDKDYMPDPGDYIKITDPIELGNGDLDLGEITLELHSGNPADTDSNTDTDSDSETGDAGTK